MTSPIMTITHYVFLTREQRYALNIPESEVEVIGCCTPVWIHEGKHLSKHAEEIFAKYRIRHCPEPEKQAVNLMEGGFLVRLSPNMPRYLLDYQDNGDTYLHLTHKNMIPIKGNTMPVIHFLNVEDSSILEETLC